MKQNQNPDKSIHPQIAQMYADFKNKKVIEFWFNLWNLRNLWIISALVVAFGFLKNLTQNSRCWFVKYFKELSVVRVLRSLEDIFLF